ncbi:3-isopropylmalate dehydratase small subunit [Reyranella sp.]|uniref:3-isopropylmalate dehydratase small subunit n=1 Tax=Reyranella sp. TaxID=1929291 RepID=UPI003D0D3603
MPQPFRSLSAVAAPIDWQNVDTDQLAPVRFLRRPRSEGYGDILFHDLRFDGERRERPDFVLNQPAFRSAGILVADRNFGVGSSREQAVWALVDCDIRCVIAESFGDIFYNNAVKHGLLLVRAAPTVLQAERCALQASPGAHLVVDLEAQSWTATDGAIHGFEIEPGRKRRLLLGLDDIQTTLQDLPEIRRFAASYRTRRPWLFQSATKKGSR